MIKIVTFFVFSDRYELLHTRCLKVGSIYEEKFYNRMLTVRYGA